MLKRALMASIKRVGVSMPERDYKLLKSFAARFDMTMGDVINEFIRHRIHTHTQKCVAVETLLELESVSLDHRLSKECWGSLCFCCIHREECASGRYSGHFAFNTERYGEWEDVGKGPLPIFD